ncbi:PadR family transcriptional regulator [Kineosporia sp. A_224]|uniref:PadR family transcriptional regulator n=1 Tax=Kineosporia sp. A_224 TaxID=1962180 RepID=UPI000B4C0D85|nr:PadR family transcriptional regulator [Kineosporia sp. A_224]
MARRSDVLELAVLGLLQESPLHGYALRKRLNDRLGVFAALSFGTLYPALRTLLTRGWIRESAATEVDGPTLGRRARIVYEITAEGKEHFQALVSSPGPDAWEDGTFDVHFAFFARTDAATRLRILENRRLRLTERMETARQARLRNRERLDEYTLALKSLGEEAVEHEVRWLSELIDSERASNMTHLDDPDKPDPSDPRAVPPT